jgi:TatD DNase family protein
MTVRYADVHCHLQFDQYEPDREAIIARMREEGVIAIVVGTGLASSREALALAEKYEHLYAAVGLHPTDSKESFEEISYRTLAEHPRVVAIGECGLDYAKNPAESQKQEQKELLQKHIKLAAELDKPLIMHVRASANTHDAHQDVLSILKEAKQKYPNLRGDIHFFTGTPVEAGEFFVLNFHISFTAVITFVREYDEVIRTAPLVNIFSETDAPYVAPASRRGERNDPLAVVEVVEQIARLRGEESEIVRSVLLANAERFFGLRAA